VSQEADPTESSATDSPSGSGLEALIAARRANLDALRELGTDPYAVTRYSVDAATRDLAERYASLSAEDGLTTEAFSLAGRVMAIRHQGKTFFLDLHDREGRLQLYIRRDEIGDELFTACTLLDRGDYVGVRGALFRSRMGELTLRVAELTVLSKAIQPFPDKWHGLVDVEYRYRRRALDLAVNPSVRETFLLRSRIIRAMREFLDRHDFYEVETPTLLPIAGGATARPFRTHANALDVDFDLRIATELALKRCIVGGMERVYEIGRIFRNEGIDTSHNPEFTMLELYAAYWSVEEMLAFNEALFAHLATLVSPDRSIRFGEKEASFAPPFARIGYLEAFARYGSLTREELLDPERAAALLPRWGLPPSPTHAHALDKLFERIVEPQLQAPTFVVDYPVVLSPLAKRRADDPLLTERYELFIFGMELANAFSELNDPDDQRRRFEEQIRERARGDREIPPPDWDFVQALEYGMPPTAGIGVGIDRLVMVLANRASIRDVLLFPMLRPTTSPAAP